MKRLFVTLAMTAAALPAFAAVDVGVSLTVGQPGFYGQIDLGNAPRPQLVQPQPVVIQPAPRAVPVQPIYLYVPPGHQKHWDKHCAEYHACGRPVYFVDERWYNEQYVPYYRQAHGNGGGGDWGDRDGDRGDDGDRGHGRGHGHGHGHGRD